MNKLSILSALFIVLSSNIFSQNDSEDFQLSVPGQKVQGSLYSKITVIDCRNDTTNMGIVQKGAFNRKAKVVPLTPIAKQIDSLFYSVIGADSNNGELILRLRHFSFAEITGAMSEKGYCYFSAELFAKVDDNYGRLSTIDTVVLINGMDVTKKILKNGSQITTYFITENLLQKPAPQEYLTRYNVFHLEDYEKRSIVLYNTTTCNDGVYLTYNSFRNQTPDKAISSAQIEKDKLLIVKTIGNKGKQQKLNPKDVYAVVYNGQLFIATEFGYNKLFKINNDFFFTGRAKASADSGDVIAASIFFGVVGGLLASDASALFYMKIDYKNGGFIRIMEIKDDSNSF